MRNKKPYHPRLYNCLGGSGLLEIGEFLGTVKWGVEGIGTEIRRRNFDIYLSEDSKYVCYRWSENTSYGCLIRPEDAADKWHLDPSFYQLIRPMIDQALSDPSVSPNAHV